MTILLFRLGVAVKGRFGLMSTDTSLVNMIAVNVRHQTVLNVINRGLANIVHRIGMPTGSTS